ncbi:MAG TPA: type II CAAX endopeptidase family protein [Anaerolineales bacterium]|nr:type II CAAX endopeptidase family protein [Anaerolineales bacterium]
MTTISSVAPAQESGLKAFAKRHPLTAYFALAYALTWVLIVPIVLSQMGLGIINLPEPLLFVFLLLSTYSGPLPAALIMTTLIDGREGRRQLVRRMLQWRLGLGWYLFLLVAYPLIFLIGLTFYTGAAPWVALFQNLPLLVTYYLPVAVIGIIFPSLGEEPGWRGFALPRLQQQYGPLMGTLILGVLHGIWHLPAYFIPGAILEGPFDVMAFAANTGLLIAMTVIWTWFFNRTGQSVFFAMFVHGVSNATSGLIPQIIAEPTGDPWASFKMGAAFALLLILFTRGRLGYRSAGEQDEIR